MDLKLDPTSWDLVVDNGDLVLLNGSDAVEQNIRQRLQLFQGEWFLDQSAGMPYYADILKKNPNLNIVDTLLKDCITGTPGVSQLTSFNLNYDPSARTLSVSFQVKASDGTIDFTNYPLGSIGQ